MKRVAPEMPTHEELAIGFANTVAWRLRDPIEDRAASPEAMLKWMLAAALLDHAAFARISTRWRKSPQEARDFLKEAVTLRAEADKQAVVIVANARKQSEILRGEGDGQASAIYAAAYGRDPAFFDFYRSMQAISTALPSDTTSYVGPADGDFFRYFLGNSYNPEAPPPPSAPAPTGGAAANGAAGGAKASGTATSP